MVEIVFGLLALGPGESTPTQKDLALKIHKLLNSYK